MANQPPAPTQVAAPVVVGIGASAGGLEALERLVRAIPEHSGLAWMIVQHLSPDHPSLMAEILEKYTHLQIAKMAEGVRPAADTIYVLPPGKQATIEGGRLHLEDKPENHITLPIDIFLRSLAADRQEAAVGVILSGSGSDGSRGLAEVSAEGGLAIAQEPDTARFDSMPRSAIENGSVDLVLPPEEIPAALLAWAERAPVLREPPPLPPVSGLAPILSMLKQRTGTDFSLYKPSTIRRRIDRRMAVLQYDDLESYAGHLRESPRELSTLHKELLIGVTRFFRDTDAFEVLERTVIPTIFAELPPDEPLRVWVSGCSTGEEAYSIGMLITEHMERHDDLREVKIFATDVDREAIELASTGSYPSSVVADIGEARAERFLSIRGERATVDPALRRMVVFAVHDIVKDPPFTRLALATCRNLLIYLETALQRRLLTMLHFGLRPDGFLFLGPSENLGELASDFATVDSRWKIYRRRGGDRPGNLPRSMRANEASPARSRSFPARRSGPSDEVAAEEVYRHLLDAYVPACLMVTEAFELVHVFGDASRFLSIRPGAASLDLMRLLPAPTSTMIRAAIHRAFRTDEEMRYTGVFDHLPDGPIDVRVRPFDDRRHASRYALVFLEPNAKPERHAPPVAHAEALAADSSGRVEDLEQELQYTKETLQATVEELETSNEELQATNEELLASNEELQATNEELHSVNEELYTVNSEYQEKIEELLDANSDLDNLFANTRIGTVFVDDKLQVRKFTAALEGLINLMERDIGRRFGDITHELDLVDLHERISEVVETRKEQSHLANSRDGREVLLRIWPYEDPRSDHGGAVLTVTDVTAARAAEHQLQAVIDSLPEHIAILDRQGRITHVNTAWTRFAEVNGARGWDRTGAGANYLEVLDEAGRVDPTVGELAQQLREVLDGRRAHLRTEYPCHSPDEQRWFVMHAGPLRHLRAGGAVVSHVEVTRLRELEQRTEQRS